jgi:siroheme synthase (precorrin-2 oxidase/ferrochelatase)
VDIYVKGAGGVFTDTLKNQIQTILTQMGSVGVDYRLFKAPSYDVDVYSVLYTGRYAISSAIRTDALSRIENLFKSAKIGQWIYRNEIIAELESIKDVKRVLLVTPSVDVQLTTQVPNLRSTRVDVVGA